MGFPSDAARSARTELPGWTVTKRSAGVALNPPVGFDAFAFEQIDWDDEEEDGSNLAHCLEHGVNERVVAEVLRERPVEVSLSVKSAKFAIVGPNGNWSMMWTLLFDVSHKRGDWLRPVTGWTSNQAQIVAWRQVTRLPWPGRR